MGAIFLFSTIKPFKVRSSVKLTFTAAAVTLDFTGGEPSFDQKDAASESLAFGFLRSAAPTQKAFLKYYINERLRMYLSGVAPYSLSALACTNTHFYSFFFTSSAFFFIEYPAVDHQLPYVAAAQNIRESMHALDFSFRNPSRTLKNYRRVRGSRSYAFNEFFISKASKALAYKFNNPSSSPSSVILRERGRISRLRAVLANSRPNSATQLLNVSDYIGCTSTRNKRPSKLLTTRLYMSFLQTASASCLHRFHLYSAACSALRLYFYTFYSQRHRRSANTTYLYLRMWLKSIARVSSVNAPALPFRYQRNSK